MDTQRGYWAGVRSDKNGRGAENIPQIPQIPLMGGRALDLFESPMAGMLLAVADPADA
jgi:hypothetical protein